MLFRFLNGIDSGCQTSLFPIQLNVRLDVFLKTSRLIKRRVLAREMCENGRVLVNGIEAKPAKEVKRGDIITLKFSSRNIELEILGVPAAALRKTPPEEFYRITSQSQLLKEDLWDKDHS